MIELTRIPSPTTSPEDLDRELQVEEALEPAFHALTVAAITAQWSQKEVAFALLRLALANVKTIDESWLTKDPVVDALQDVDPE